MPSSKRISPVNLEWLRNSLPRSRNGDRAYLQPFYDNVLYYPPKESRDKVHSTVMSVLQSDPIADFADTDMTTCRLLLACPVRDRAAAAVVLL